jgi:hypothetical protein
MEKKGRSRLRLRPNDSRGDDRLVNADCYSGSSMEISSTSKISVLLGPMGPVPAAP